MEWLLRIERSATICNIYYIDVVRFHDIDMKSLPGAGRQKRKVKMIMN